MATYPRPEADPVAEASLAAHAATKPAHGGDLAGTPRPPTAHVHIVDEVTGLQVQLDEKAASIDLDSLTLEVGTKADAAELSAFQPLSARGQANGYAALDGSGRIATSQLPALSITSTSTVASQAAQLALTAQEGDVAVRTDESKTYIHNGGATGTMSDWTLLATPVDSVLSVAGKTGAVTLTAADVGAAPTVHTHAQSDVTGLTAALEARATTAELATLTSRASRIDLSSDWSAGDLLGARVTVPPAAHKFDLRDGTAAAPAKLGVTASLSRVDATTRAELNAMGPKGTDGPDGNSAFRISIKGTEASEVQVTSLTLRAWQTGAYAGSEGSADATPLMALARVSGAGTGRAIPAYLESVRETATSKGQQGLEIRVKNESGEDDSYVSGSGSKSMGIWLCAQGSNRAAAAFQIGANFGQKFDVGFAANSETLVSAFARDDSKALRSVFIRGEHEKGAIIVNKGAGQVVIGREEAQQTTPLLEVFSETGLDPIVSFGSNTGASHRAQLIRNSTGSLGGFASNISNGFLTGTVQGDVGLTHTPGKAFHIGAATKTSLFRINETGVAVNGATPVAKAAAIASPTESLASIKVAVDFLREAVKNFGITG